MSDTPRTGAAWKQCLADDSRIQLKEESEKLERELNEANARIKRLIEAGDAALRLDGDRCWEMADKIWNEAKGVK